MANFAIFGGTFNPFHIGHYEMLSAVCELDYIDKVFVMPDKIPPHKILDYKIDDLHRQKMCEIVCDDFDKASLCLLEFERDGKSFTMDTINILRDMYPHDRFFVTIGGDMLSTLDTWYNWKELIKLVSFIAFKRRDYTDFSDAYNRLTKLGADILIVEKEITSVSSTQLRKKLDKELLPINVYNYIVEKGIYNDRNI